jgi:hypothetical protein
VDTEPIFYKATPEGYHFIFKDEWVVDEKGGMKFINKRKLELQKDIFKYLLK